MTKNCDLGPIPSTDVKKPAGALSPKNKGSHVGDHKKAKHLKVNTRTRLNLRNVFTCCVLISSPNK